MNNHEKKMNRGKTDLEMISSISGLFVEKTDPTELFPKVAKILCKEFDCSASLIELKDEKSNEMVLIGQYGFSYKRKNPFRVSIDNTFSEKVVNTGKDFFTTQGVTINPSLKTLFKELKFKTQASVAIKSDNNVLGVISIFDLTVKPELEERIGLMKIVSVFLGQEIVRGETEKALKKSETFFLSFLDQIPAAIKIKNRKLEHVYANKYYLEILNKTLNEFIGTRNIDFYPPKMAKQLDDRDKAALLRSETLSSVVGPFLINGEERYYEDYKFPLELASGEIMSGTFAINITNRRKAEAALRDSEEKYRTLFNNAPIGIITIDKDGNVLELNEKILEILGSPSVEETKKINILTFPPLVKSGVSEAIENCIKSGTYTEYVHEYTSKWGKRVFLSYHLAPTFDSKGKISGAQAIVEDGTRRKLAEIQLEESIQQLKIKQAETEKLMENLSTEVEERKKTAKQLEQYIATLNSIFLASPIGIGLAVNRKFIKVNKAICRMSGYTEDELLGQSTRVIYPSLNEFELVGYEKYRQLEEKGAGYLETKWKHKDGKIIDVLLCSSPIDQKNLAEGITFTAVDITERKQQEEQITSSLAEKEVLLKEIHHRVKNNLQIIMSLLTLQSRNIADPTILDLFSESRNRIFSMALVHEKLYESSDLAKIQFGEYIRTMAHELFSTYNVTGKCQLELDMEDVELGIDKAIPCALIVNELMTNALKYAYPGNKKGKILVCLKKLSNGKLMLVVSDKGVGLPDGFDINLVKSLGMQLIKVLSRQIDGDLAWNGKKGTEFKIEFSSEFD